jgi:hypothetical protein
MAISLRRRRLGMTEKLSKNWQRHPRCRRYAGETMPKIVNSDVRQFRCSANPAPWLFEIFQVLPVPSSDDNVRVSRQPLKLSRRHQDYFRGNQCKQQLIELLRNEELGIIVRVGGSSPSSATSDIRDLPPRHRNLESPSVWREVTLTRGTTTRLTGNASLVRYTSLPNT